MPKVNALRMPRNARSEKTGGGLTGMPLRLDGPRTRCVYTDQSSRVIVQRDGGRVDERRASRLCVARGWHRFIVRLSQ
jgi:hypothetical protein